MMRRILFSLLVLSALGPVAAHGESNAAYIDQIGNHNEVTVSQDGFGHSIKTYQDGTKNQIIAKQSGDSYRAMITQQGQQNFVDYNQVSGNAVITQQGHGHKASVVSNIPLPPGAQPITVTQFGNGATVSIKTTR
jgi:hypothetical protein